MKSSGNSWFASDNYAKLSVDQVQLELNVCKAWVSQKDKNIRSLPAFSVKLVEHSISHAVLQQTPILNCRLCV